jgi:hypothetical protein
MYMKSIYTKAFPCFLKKPFTLAGFEPGSSVPQADAMTTLLYLFAGLWNWIFVLSNVALFLCLPFAYLFCESEGLPFLGTRRVRAHIP